LADRRCEVLASHVTRSGGGVLVDSFESFAAALDDLLAAPRQWRDRGGPGRDYVREHYGSRTAFARNLEQFIRELKQPLRERLGRRGAERAAQFGLLRWREQFGRLVEELLDQAPRTYQPSIEIAPRSGTRTANVGADAVLVPVSVRNGGTHPLVSEGPARVLLHARVEKEGTGGLEGPDVPLPTLIVPGQTASIAVPVLVPANAGTYSVRFHAGDGRETNSSLQERPSGFTAADMDLIVNDNDRGGVDDVCQPMLQAVEVALVELQRLQRLPDDYTDVTAGRFASLKRWIKRKLLGNFQRAYVDVLSRQQSGFNRETLTALSELRECCATLQNVSASRAEIAKEQGGDLTSTSLVRRLLEQLSESRRQCAALEERVASLERRPAHDAAGTLEKA
jgi:hypothetical protein